jgi:hypothetical protein
MIWAAKFLPPEILEPGRRNGAMIQDDGLAAPIVTAIDRKLT